MVYFNARNNLNGNQPQELDTILNDWERYNNPSGKKIVKNLKKECFLPQHSMLDLLVKIIQYHRKHNNGFMGKSKFHKIKISLRSEFYRNYQMHGGYISEIHPKYIGTVMSLDAFVLHLITKYPHRFGNKQEVFDTVKDWEKGEVDRFANEFFINEAKNLVWMTWDEFNPNRHMPFDYLMHGREELRTSLGLGDKKYKNGKLISFVFRYDHALMKGFQLYKPTFCDADFNIYFRPAKCNQKHGWTKPINKGKFFRGHKSFKTNRKPEGIGRCANLPLKFLFDCKIHY